MVRHPFSSIFFHADSGVGTCDRHIEYAANFFDLSTFPDGDGETKRALQRAWNKRMARSRRVDGVRRVFQTETIQGCAEAGAAGRARRQEEEGLIMKIRNENHLRITRNRRAPLRLPFSVPARGKRCALPLVSPLPEPLSL
jgi:hypothetical protein